MCYHVQLGDQIPNRYIDTSKYAYSQTCVLHYVTRYDEMW